MHMLKTTKKLNHIEIKDIIEKSTDVVQKEKMIIFCYGTLKRGFYNHQWLGENKYFGGLYLNGYRMYTNGIYPAIVKSDNQDDVIYGELYEIDKNVFDPIIRMELGANYNMEEIDIELHGKRMKVPIFTMKSAPIGWKLIKNGIFTNERN